MVSLILLASGFGKRYGSNKLLSIIDGREMYLHILEKLQHIKNDGNYFNNSNCDIDGLRVIVVSQYDEILESAREYGMEAVLNNEAKEGIAASIRLGVEKANGSDWYFFFMADQPYLKEETIVSFIEEVLNCHNSMASVHYRGTPGSPTAFNNKWHDDLMALTGDVGGRKLMKANPSDVFWHEIAESEIVDIDFS